MSQIFQQLPFNYQYKVGLENCFWQLSQSVSRNGTISNAFLHQIIVPLNVLVQDGQRIYIEGQGTQNNLGAASTLNIRINSVDQMLTPIAASGGSTLGWFAEITIRRISSVSIDTMLRIASNYPTTGTTPAVGSVNGIRKTIAVPDLITNGLTIDFLATIPGVGDNITQTLSEGSVM